MKIEQLTKSFGKTQVLKKINFELSQGEKVAILGSNGAGKSTLMNIINGTLTPTTGKIATGAIDPIEFISSDTVVDDSFKTAFADLKKEILVAIRLF